MACESFDQFFDAYLEESLDGEARASYERHIEGCVWCSRELEVYRRTEQFLGHVALPSMPDTFWRHQRMSIAKAISPRPVWTAPSFSLVCLLAIVACYVFVGFDWLFISFGTFLVGTGGAAPAHSPLRFDGFDTVILLYLGLFSLALMVFLSDKEEERPLSHRR